MQPSGLNLKMWFVNCKKLEMSRGHPVIENFTISQFRNEVLAVNENIAESEHDHSCGYRRDTRESSIWQANVPLEKS